MPDFKSHEIRGQWSNNIDILAVLNLFILLIEAAYTYYKILCQQKSLSDRGRADDMKMNRRRSERIRRVCD